VLIRFGASPTEIRAIRFKVSGSIANTDRSAEFETQTILPSGVNGNHSGTAPGLAEVALFGPQCGTYVPQIFL
jgi:hypothetical protein